MKTQLKLATLALLSTFILQPSSLLAQGSLTPPGAPAPTMKTLAQIEPRTPISSAPFTISAGGSYYLTTNLTVATGNAITIAADGVTLDLNGFTIYSTAPSATGTAILFSSGRANVAIYNGHISSGVTNTVAGVFSGAGFGSGIAGSAFVSLSNVRVKDVSVVGVSFKGIDLGFSSSVVEACAVNVAGGNGIVAASVSDSTAMNCGITALSAYAMHNCTGQGIGNGNGLYATTANNCYGTSSGSGYGVQAPTANNCYGTSFSGTGLAATTANNCSGTSSTGDGLSATTANNCSGTSSGNGRGLHASATATGCYGISSTGIGVFAAIASNCVGSSTGTGTGFGVFADTANNCRGSSSSGTGVFADTANNCYGVSSSGAGVFAASIAHACNGYSSSGTGLYALIASVCHGGTSSGIALDTPHNVNSF